MNNLLVGPLFLFITLLGVNQIVMRTDLFRRPVLYGCLQVLNVFTAGLVAVAGVPGFENMPYGVYVLSIILLFRVVMNHFQRREAFAEDRAEQLEIERRKVLEQLERLREDEEGGERPET